MSMKRKRPSLWDRCRVGDPLFHDPALQRAYWQTWRVFADQRARDYVDFVFWAAAGLEGLR